MIVEKDVVVVVVVEEMVVVVIINLSTAMEEVKKSMKARESHGICGERCCSDKADDWVKRK